MSAATAFWHIVNLLAPAIGIGSVAAFLSKALWRRSLHGVSWWRLARAATLCCMLVLVAGLMLLGRDGKLATYGATVVACALTLWSMGFAGRSR